jgi:two-component system, chemotaxis family, sensor kinase CheA
MMDELQQAFVQESGEQLLLLEDTLLLLEKNPNDEEAINTLFRCAHTIKGAAGVVECHYIVEFTHVMENVLDEMRAGVIIITNDLAALLLHGKDHIAALLALFASGETQADADTAANGAELVSRLRHYLPQEDEPAAASVPVEKSGVTSSNSSNGGSDCWHISIRFGSDVLRNGMDPLSFLRYLATLGEIVHLETICDAIPAADQFDPESCYLGFEISFLGNVDKERIERVFEFVRDECMLRILPPQSKVSEFLQLIHDLPEDDMRIGEILVKSGALTREELSAGLQKQYQVERQQPKQEGSETRKPPIGEILVEEQLVQRDVVDAAVAKQAKVSEKRALEARLIRVQADKLDNLIDLVGELVIAGASGVLLAERSGQSDLVEAFSSISRLVEEIRNSALQLRMVQIGETFNRFHRVVRDTSRELGKEIELVIEGGETELDKSVVEKIGDPLMHLVRNSMDHGLESAEERIAAGKPPRGQVRFNAYHESGSIVIEVADDGRGLNRDRLLRKAIEKGLVNPGQNLTDNEIYKLIFEPGFSTADKVTNLSGRGVGMDVVRRNIDSLRGSIDIESAANVGTTIRIRLPLTLAIIDGFLVGVGKASYIIPLDYVVECMELDSDATASRNYINLRGEVLPFLRLRDLFQIEGEVSRRQNIIVVQSSGQKAGLVVDHLWGEFQTVIKPLGELFRYLRGIAGSTILGTGEVALIIDVQSLIRIAANHDEMTRLSASTTAALPNLAL